MINSKPLWWTSLIAWISLSIYWHLCKIKHLCDAFPNTGFFGENTSPDSIVFTNKIYVIASWHIDADLLLQYVVMLGVTFVLAYCTGNSYGGQRKTELRYKLGRIEREIQFYSRMQ